MKIELPGKEPFTLRRGGKGILMIVRQPKEMKEPTPARVTEVRRLTWDPDGNLGVGSGALSSDGRLLLLSRSTGSRVWEVPSGKVVTDVAASLTAFTPDDKQIVGVDTQTARIFDAESGKQLRQFGRASGPARILSVDSPGDR